VSLQKATRAREDVQLIHPDEMIAAFPDQRVATRNPFTLEHFPEKWIPVLRKEMRQTSNLERFPATVPAISWPT
jgi:hypothetical protein